MSMRDNKNFATISHETGKTLQRVSAPFQQAILLVQECDDWLVHSSSVRGAASLLRKRLSPSDPEPEDFRQPLLKTAAIKAEVIYIDVEIKTTRRLRNKKTIETRL